MRGNLARLVIVAMASAVLAFGACVRAQPTFSDPARYQPSADELASIHQAMGDLERALAPLRNGGEGARRDQEPYLADVEVYLKAAQWVTRFGEFFRKEDARLALEVLKHGLERARALAAGRHDWTAAEGSTIRGFRSAIDGSVQPYALIIPKGFSPAQAARLDVVLHGRGATLTEVSFIHAHDGTPAPAGQEGLVLHIFGRTNNAYRWAGETDVFEAIEAVKTQYRVDPARVVLRGFSMGGAGAWHLGLHHPFLWCSVEAGAGFTDTKRYMKLGELLPVQEKGLAIYDAVDYAPNAFNVPMAGYGGELDAQLQASRNIVAALEAAGYATERQGLVTRARAIDFVQIVGAGMGHKVDPTSAALLKQFHAERAARGRDPLPREIRFITYTLKYASAGWLSIEALGEHYKPATVKARRGDGMAEIEASNVAVLAVDRRAGRSVRLGGQVFTLEASGAEGAEPALFRHQHGRWEPLQGAQGRAFRQNAERGKRRGLQGPIDDAFTGPFLCVQGTGTPWNPAIQAWADARLKQFAETWARRLRGEVRIKRDTEVTAADLARYHIIAFGDPGSNRVVAQALEALPLRWSRDQVELGSTYAAADHVPVLIAPSPLNPGRYLVINTGHTFDEKAFAGSNALLYPRLGDYAVLRVQGDREIVKASGYFDEDWHVK